MTPALKDKRTLVTGGSRGIGAAIVKRLTRDGARVAFTYASKADEAERTSRSSTAPSRSTCARCSSPRRRRSRT